MAQLYGLVFVQDYPLKVGGLLLLIYMYNQSVHCTLSYVQWTSFFEDLLQCLQSGLVWTVDLYLRILLAIDENIVERQMIHTAEVCAYFLWDGIVVLNDVHVSPD